MRDVASGLNVPVSIVWGPDRHIWVAERSGRISRIDPETGEGRQLLQVPDVFLPESRGILGMAMHPDFADSPQLFLYYTYQNVYPGGWDLWGKVVRYTYDGDLDTLVEATVILDSMETVQWNFGGAMLALPDNTLLIGTGDGAEFFEEAQSHTSSRGKIFRVGFDGSIPQDNPWKNYPPPLDALWATGLRNPLGLASGPSGKVYGTDWGAESLDEVNIIEGGRNYGWPYAQGACDGYPSIDEARFCADSNAADPLYEWYKVELKALLPTDVQYYEEGAVAGWKGSLITASLNDGLHQLQLDESGTAVVHAVRYLAPGVDPASPGALRSLCISPEGRVFVGTGNAEGTAGSDKIIEITDAEDVPPNVTMQTRTVAAGLNVPWDIEWGTDNYLWLTERPGHVSRLDPETGALSRILTIPEVFHDGEAKPGLLGLALHPNFCDSPFVFLAYTYLPTGNPALIYERLARYTYDQQGDTLLDPVVLIDSIEASFDHAGSRLVIARDRTIFMTTGDADKVWWTQDPARTHGKILRIGIDGTAPRDNPWADKAWPGCLVWSVGHRNPQGLAFGPDSILYASEHGPWNDDEVNIVTPGSNYGWPNVTGYCDSPSERAFCDTVSVAEPILAWTPTIAPGGLAYYPHSAIPEWEGSLLSAVMKDQRLLQIRLKGDGMEVDTVRPYFAYEFGRLRDVCVAPDGRVFLATSNRDGFGLIREGDDRVIEVRSVIGHPPLPEPGALCDTAGRIDTADVEDTATTDVPHQLGHARNGPAFFPHPVRYEGVLQLGRIFGNGSVRIYDIAGVLVRSEEFGGGDSWRFVRRDLAAGVYMIEIADAKNVLRARVMVE